MTATTWDNVFKTANVTLSGSNLVATSSGAAVGGGATIKMTGKSYFEITCTTLTGTPRIGLTTWVLFAGALGSTAASLGYASTGAVTVNNVTLATIQTFIQGNRIGVAVDPAARLIWFRVNNGNWNNNAANNPATGVGGIDFSSMTPDQWFPAYGMSATGTVWTAKFSTAFTDTAPSGFSSVDSVQVAAVRLTPPSTRFGAVAVTVNKVRFNPSLRTGTKRYYTSLTSGSASGIVSENGVPISGKTVRAYDEATGDYLGCATTDGSGAWSINCLGRAKVYIVAFDTPYNSLIFDNVIPG